MVENYKLLSGACSIHLPQCFLTSLFQRLDHHSLTSYLLTFSRHGMLEHIHPLSLHLSNSPSLSTSHQTLPPSLSVFFPGGEHNLISHCWMRRPLLSGSR